MNIIGLGFPCDVSWQGQARDMKHSRRLDEDNNSDEFRIQVTSIYMSRENGMKDNRKERYE